MKNPLLFTRSQLMDIMFKSQTRINIGGFIVIPQSVTREDGSGRNFILAVLCEGKIVNHFVKITD